LSITVSSLGKKERTVLNLKERRAEVEARKKGVELYEYDEQGYPIRPRWELVASHTARRSCITNMYLSKKYDIREMMLITGHKRVENFMKYIKLTLDEEAYQLALSSDGEMF
jgi:hypothetical protein